MSERPPPSPSARAGDLEAALALTREMLARARAGDWAPLPGLEAERRARIERAFAGTVTLDESEALGALGADILALDRELQALAREARDASAEALRRLTTGRRARAAYRDQR